MTTSKRIQSVDFLRGLVMILMAIDHVRVYSGLPPGGPEPAIFFTRWITHFCAPAFVFLSGASAFLYGNKLNDRNKLFAYLLSRGFILVVLEITLIRFFWTFNFDFSNFTLAGVIWMIGWCMILLASLIWLKPVIVGFIGVLIILFQNLFAFVPNFFREDLRVSFGHFWEFIYSSNLEGPTGITILYVLVPWIGVMATGYGFGSLLLLEETKRRKILISLGLGLTVSFLIVGSIMNIVNPQQNEMPFVMQLLNQRKYPASQLYLLMTLGPSILIIAFSETISSTIGKAIVLIGRVPFFYYLMHILLIHLSALVVQLVRFGRFSYEDYATAPYAWVPDEHQWNLGLLYFVFFIDVILLYFMCRWYESYKFSHLEKNWLKYL